MGRQERRFDNDWLTILAMLTIFFYHCARFFNNEDWHVKNNQLDGGMTLFVAIVTQWIMPLFFVLSGMSTFYSLKSRKVSKYLSNRLKRLFVPLLVGTFIILVPIQVWIERVSHSQFEGSFLEFYPHYFDGFYPFGGNFAWMGLHLWYLEMLFLFSLLTLPLFLLHKKEKVQRWISDAAGFFDNIGAIFLLSIPIFVMEWFVNLQPEGVGIRAFGGWSLFTYLIVFMTGFWVACDPGYRKGMERSRYLSLALGLLTTALLFFFPIDLTAFGGTTQYAIRIFVRSFNSWFWLVAILGFGSKYLNFNHGFLKYARQAVLPFYILHQTVIVTIGFYIAHWQMNVMLKYLILSTSSFMVIVFLYELLIKRVKALAFVFGLQVRN